MMEAKKPNRMPGAPLTAAERDEVVHYLTLGFSQHEVAKLMSIAQSTVSRIASEAGVASPHPVLEAANAARKEQRARVFEKALDVIRERLEEESLSARDIRELVTAAAIVEDKMRLQERP